LLNALDSFFVITLLSHSILINNKLFLTQANPKEIEKEGILKPLWIQVLYESEFYSMPPTIPLCFTCSRNAYNHIANLESTATLSTTSNSIFATKNFQNEWR
jgi:hypothetical protein